MKDFLLFVAVLLIWPILSVLLLYWASLFCGWVAKKFKG